MKKAICKTAAVVTAAAMVLMIAGCASAPAASQQAAPERPDWVINPPEDEELIYGMGSAVSANESRGWKLAANRARLDISYQLTTIVEGMQIDYQLQAGNDDVETGQEFFQDISRQLTAHVLSGAKVVKRGDGNDGKYYVLTSYSVSAVRDSVKSMAETAAKKAEISANAALQALDRALANKRTPTLVESGGEE
ncbi:MAG: LPP20 family lipoprotein [Spirochaetaceae bacterium]|nr:LPP20 family lipoprotein [Spirochaetaceae bacterium]